MSKPTQPSNDHANGQIPGESKIFDDCKTFDDCIQKIPVSDLLSAIQAGLSPEALALLAQLPVEERLVISPRLSTFGPYNHLLRRFIPDYDTLEPIRRQLEIARLVAFSPCFTVSIEGGIITPCLGAGIITPCLGETGANMVKDLDRLVELLQALNDRVNAAVLRTCRCEDKESEQVAERAEHELLGAQPSDELVQAVQDLLELTQLPLLLIPVYFVTQRDFLANGARLCQNLGVQEHKLDFTSAIGDLWDHQLRTLCDRTSTLSSEANDVQARRTSKTARLYSRVYNIVANNLTEQEADDCDMDTMHRKVAAAYVLADDVDMAEEEKEELDEPEHVLDDCIQSILVAILMHAHYPYLSALARRQGVVAYDSLPGRATLFRLLFGHTSELYRAADDQWDDASSGEEEDMREIYGFVYSHDAGVQAQAHDQVQDQDQEEEQEEEEVAQSGKRRLDDGEGREGSDGQGGKRMC